MEIASNPRGGAGETRLKHTIGKIDSKNRRIHFLKDCLAEQVVPPSAPKHLKDGDLPFKTSASAWIQESIQDLTNELEIHKRDKASLTNAGVRLPHSAHQELQRQDQKGRRASERKLRNAINKSTWRTMGRDDIVTNLSDRPLSAVEREALSLGPKFDTGKQNKDLADMLISNHRWSESATDQGVIQGLVLAAFASAKGTPSSLPRRYLQALKGLRKDESIRLTTADKGGGFVVLNTQDYRAKMHTLLNDQTTYRKVRDGNAKAKSKVFTQVARSILTGCESGNNLARLLPQNPRTPSMRGLPKVHKPGVPMRPITNGKDSAPHRLASALAVPLTKTLGSISGCHLTNSTDLINRLRDRRLRNKKLVGLDVVSLFTRVPVDEALAAARRALDLNPDLDLPVPADIFMKLVEICVRFGAFEFESEEYEQIDGLPMGSPLSGVLANLFMETLEADHYLGIVGAHALWIRYADDVTLLVAVRVVTDDLAARLNAVYPWIQFTWEKEQDNQLPVLDVMIKRDSNHQPRFAVYRKPTCKDDYIHYLSAHSERVKSGVVIGLFLRALRICSPECLDDEFNHIIQAFRKLHYPEGMLERLRRTAIRITEAGPRQRERDTRPILIVPHSPLTEQLEQHFGPHLRIATPAQTKIGEMVKTARTQHTPEGSVVYKIPCGDDTCGKAYYGQTSRGLKTRLGEHKNDFRKGNEQSPFLRHAWDTDHPPGWTKAVVVHAGIASKTKRLYLESALIRANKNFNSGRRQSADFKIGRIVAQATCPRP